MLAAACGGGRAANGQGLKGLSVAAGSGQVTRVPAGHRKAAPTLAGPQLGGGTLRLRPGHGHVTVVNVWGSWCAPCRAEAAALEDAHKTTQAGGVRFVGIDVRDSDPSALAFDHTYHVTYPSVTDPSGTLMLDFQGIIPVQAVPTTVVIDRRGNVAATVVGKVDYLTLHDLIDYARGRRGRPGPSPTASRHG